MKGVQPQELLPDKGARAPRPPPEDADRFGKHLGLAGSKMGLGKPADEPAKGTRPLRPALCTHLCCG